MQTLGNTKLHNSIYQKTEVLQIDDTLFCTPENLRRKTLPSVLPENSPLSVVDLFCGCGGLSYGALLAGLNHNRDVRFKLAVDFNAAALGVYKSNFGKYSLAIRQEDIEALVTLSSKAALPTKKEKSTWESIGAIDLIVAGPPCQGHSDLNNSSRRSDPRNMLYLAPARAAASLKPKVLIIENVPTVIRSTENVVNQSKILLQRLGYYVEELTIDLTRIGIPQSRTRHVQIASLKPLDNLIESIKRLPPKDVGCYEFIRDLENEAIPDGNALCRTTRLSADNVNRINYLFRNNVYDLPNSMRPPCHRDKEHSYVSMYGRLDPYRPAQTITSGFGSMGQGRFVHPTKPRMITAHEAARLQGFPDSFSFSNCLHVTKLREMIGNAVPPQMTQVIVSLLITYKHFD